MPYEFENLGRPLKPKPVAIETVTRDKRGRRVAWGAVVSPERKGLIGVDVETGKSLWVGLEEFRYGRINLTRAKNGHLYLYTGNPGRFFKYDVNTRTLVDLGVPAEPASYTMGAAVGPDGKFYVGSYPKTTVVCVDPSTDRTESLGPMTADPRDKYVLQTVVSDDNVVYVAVGLHHAELWAYDRRNDVKRQVLPTDISEAFDRVRISVSMDGQVYGRAGDRAFRCQPSTIELVERTPPERSNVPFRRVGDYFATSINPDGDLVLKHAKTRKLKRIATDFDGVAVLLMGAFCEHKGKIYGGGFQPAHVFQYAPATGKMADLGRHTGGRIQIYDILSHPKGLFLSSYVGAHQDFYDPDTGKQHHIATLLFEYEQERGIQLTLGPDRMVYLASRPSKGKLGGALTRINPDDFTYQCWRNAIPNQSVLSVVAVPQTGEMFCTSSTYGGSGCVPTEKEGYIFLWDCAKEAVSWKGTPFPGDISYGKAVMAHSGLIYVQAHERYFAFDPVRREVMHRGQMPVEKVRPLGITGKPAGKKGLIYGLGDDAVFAFDPSDHGARVIARHSSIERARGVFVTDAGVLYYGSGSGLWRVDMEP